MNWNIVLVWAGWTGMSAVAWILSELWYDKGLICLDWNQSELTDKLQKNESKSWYEKINIKSDFLTM